ncbi:MAG: glycosyl hydrolase family 28 protein [Bacteroidales bacterium]|nr:glycosyl hydrolase family 28 protein [Bacteroidales bacterium]MDD4821609.1 glycosyl hydrolase family 28 protein [Bacteroidales bacterium]
MNTQSKTAIICLLILFINSASAQKNTFDHLKLAANLENMSQKLEKSLAVSHNQLPVLDVVKDFGAINNGLTITTKQLQNAIDSCSKIGPARVFFPEGVYLTGTLVLKSGVHIELDKRAKILGSADPKDYLVIMPAYKNNTDRQVDKSLFYAENVDGISFTGKGIIDFQGTNPIYWPTGNNDPRRPFGIRIVSSKNIYVSGLMLMNSAQWLQHYLDCENVMVENITVFNHAHQNNDGIDIDGCRNVYVRNSRIDSDDDAICLKSNGLSACENILIENCTASSHCNALKLGTESTGGYKNIIYRNCKVVQSGTGRHFVNGTETTRTAITLIITDGGVMENIWFDSIESTDCVTPIFVTLGNRNRKHTDSAPKPGIGTINNILISNVTATGAGPISSSVTGLDNEHRISNITLKNIHIELAYPGNAKDRNTDMFKLLKERKPGYPSPDTFGNLSTYGLYLRYIDNLQLYNIQFKLKCTDPRDEMIMEDCDKIVKQIMNKK